MAPKRRANQKLQINIPEYKFPMKGLVGGDTEDDSKVYDSVHQDLANVKKATELGKDHMTLNEENLEKKKDKQEEEEEKADPYLMADAHYIQKDLRWKNKQRCLVFCGRGTKGPNRYLVEDIRRLLPHHKEEPKYDKNQKERYKDMAEICEMKSCNNCVYFEARKKGHMFVVFARMPKGPTMRFQVRNLHTTKELRLVGNCLHGSRPILHFDKHFENGKPHMKLIRHLFMQVFGVPRNHPKSKPFHDHVISFHWFEGRIWVRHYQIQPDTIDDADEPERQVMVEIGPRFSLDPVVITAGPFSGETIYRNGQYFSPTMTRAMRNRAAGDPKLRQMLQEADSKKRAKDLEEDDDPLDEAFGKQKLLRVA